MNSLSCSFALVHILQIVCKVWVFVITASSVPFDFSVPISFGTYPGVSAGEIFELTASGAEVIFCDYSFALDPVFVDYFIHIPQVTAEKLQSGRAYLYEPAYQVNPLRVLTLTNQPIVGVQKSTQVPRGSSSTELRLCGITPRTRSLRAGMRHNLMMTAPRVWSTDKITDEGSFGKSRNPRRPDWKRELIALCPDTLLYSNLICAP